MEESSYGGELIRRRAAAQYTGEESGPLIPNRTGCCRGEFRLKTASLKLDKTTNTTAELTIEIVGQTLLIKEVEDLLNLVVLLLLLVFIAWFLF